MARSLTQYRVDVHVLGPDRWQHGPTFAVYPTDDQVSTVYWSVTGIRSKDTPRPDKVRVVEVTSKVIIVKAMT